MATAAVGTPAPLPLEGDLRDVGPARRDTIRARSYSLVGDLKVQGDLVVGSATLDGIATVGGKVVADQLRSNGNVQVAGDVNVRGQLTVRGSHECRGALSAGELIVNGDLQVAGPISVNGHAEVKGRLETSAGVTARAFEFDGSLVIPGTLETPVLKGYLRRPSRIRLLKSQNVRILRSPFSSVGAATLTVDRIEASDVELTDVDCEYVRADRLRLGPRCHVTRVDGVVVYRHRSARVGPRSWEPIPPGLSR